MSQHPLPWLIAVALLLCSAPVFAQNTCASALSLNNTNLPYTSPHWGSGSGHTTCGAGIDYTTSSPGACGNTNENGEDFVFAFTATATVCLDLSLSYLSNSISMFVYDGCPDQAGTTCREYDTSGDPREIFGLTVPAGETHYIVCSRSSSCGYFMLSLSQSSGPVGSDVCNAEVLDNTQFPYATTITTCGAIDNYDQNSIALRMQQQLQLHAGRRLCV